MARGRPSPGRPCSGRRDLLALRACAGKRARRLADRLRCAVALETCGCARDSSQSDLLWRGDSVAFPPGGCAYLHRHQGPGIRCLIEGGIRIDTQGRSTHYAPGEAWYEAGPDPVFAQAAEDQPTRFVRVLILPRDLIGKSSIQYVNEADKSKPRSQQYKVFFDAPIAFRGPDE